MVDTCTFLLIHVHFITDTCTFYYIIDTYPFHSSMVDLSILHASVGYLFSKLLMKICSNVKKRIAIIFFIALGHE